MAYARPFKERHFWKEREREGDHMEHNSIPDQIILTFLASGYLLKKWHFANSSMDQLRNKSGGQI